MLSTGLPVLVEVLGACSQVDGTGLDDHSEMRRGGPWARASGPRGSATPRHGFFLAKRCIRVY